jgi:hypothetical protein
MIRHLFKLLKKIISSTSKVVDASKDFVLQKKEKLDEIVG